MTKQLIWLEDHPELNTEIKKKLEESGFDVVLCQNVKAFGEAVKAHQDKPDKIAGFILDIVIPADSLVDLGMPQVTPQRGAETGYAILRQYIRDIRNRSPLEGAFKEHPVLVLSTMSEASMQSSFNTKADDYTTWLSKADKQGHTSAVLTSLQQWLQTLKNRVDNA